MELINNTTKTLRDDLAAEIKQGSKLSIAAACFSIYAFQELKKELQGIDELRFIFTSPTFTTEKTKKERREFPRVITALWKIRNWTLTSWHRPMVFRKSQGCLGCIARQSTISSQVAISILSRSAGTTEPPRRVLRNGIRTRTATDW